jgi:hypothetical protein
MNGTLSSGRLRSPSLGVFTWAELQAQYPNGGGSLALLSADARATLTNVGKLPCTVMPNAAKTYWVAENGLHRVARYCGSLTTPWFTASGADATYSPPGGAISMPAGLVQPGQGFQIQCATRRRNANASLYGNVHLGTAGSTADPVVVALLMTAGTNPSHTHTLVFVKVATLTRVTANAWLGPINANNVLDTFDFTTNINFAAAMNFTFAFDLSHASDFGDLLELDILWSCT